MRRVLFLAHRIPYPPNKGEKIRAWHILRHFAADSAVDLGTFVDDPADWAGADAVRSICHRSRLLPLDRRIAALRGGTSLLTGEPITLGYFDDGRLQRWVRERLQSTRYDLVFLYSAAMGVYLPAAMTERPPVVLDFVDMDSAKWAGYAMASGGPSRWLYRREAATLARAERRLALDVDASLFATEEEASAFRRDFPEAADRVHAVHNGVDTDHFQPGMRGENPYGPGGPVLVFTGVMDYRPNVEAVTWFADRVLPALQRRHPALRFCIAGARPAPGVQRLAERSGILVTGAQPDLRPYLGHARIAIAPLRVGRGIQNKVLEAMAMGLPVVASPEARCGVDAQPGRDLLVADGETAWIAAVEQLLAAPDRARTLGEAARLRMRHRYSWQARLAGLDQVLAGLRPATGHPGLRSAGGWT